MSTDPRCRGTAATLESILRRMRSLGTVPSRAVVHNSITYTTNSMGDAGMLCIFRCAWQLLYPGSVTILPVFQLLEDWSSLLPESCPCSELCLLSSCVLSKVAQHVPSHSTLISSSQLKLGSAIRYKRAVKPWTTVTWHLHSSSTPCA